MNINKKLKIIIFASFSLILMGIIFLAGINIYIVNFAKPYIYTEIADLPESYTVIQTHLSWRTNSNYWKLKEQLGYERIKKYIEIYEVKNEKSNLCFSWSCSFVFGTFCRIY